MPETAPDPRPDGAVWPGTADDACTASVIWDERLLRYDFGEHPMRPIRLERTMRLARELGVLERVDLRSPEPADEAALRTAHSADYLDAVRAASHDPSYVGHGLGTSDDPVFTGMFDASALIAGGSLRAAQDVRLGRARHAVNIAGGLHHAMRDHASGFCVLNDVVVAIRWLLSSGVERIAYVDVDVHHGDGVQAAFYEDPRVLTISLHQHPATLFPGTGLAAETGAGDAVGAAANLPLPPGTDDAGWLRAFNAVVPSLVRAHRPQILVTQCGCDTHHADPLADLALTVDGQRAAIELLHRMAHEHAGGRWLALGGGGYGVLSTVPRTWTHLIAEAAGHPVDPSTPIPSGWIEAERRRGTRAPLPTTMGEGVDVSFQPWQPLGDGLLDRCIAATRHACFPLAGLDPDDPRD